MRARSLWLGCAAALQIGSAGAVTIDFDGLTGFSTDFIERPSPYTEDGFMLEAPGNFASVHPPHISYLGSVHFLGDARMTNTSGLLFNLDSIDLNTQDAGLGPPIFVNFKFFGTKPDGTIVTQSFDLDLNQFGFETFTFGPAFDGLTEVRWESGYAYYDNIVATPIPEPSSMTLFALALAGLALTRAGRRPI